MQIWTTTGAVARRRTRCGRSGSGSSATTCPGILRNWRPRRTLTRPSGRCGRTSCGNTARSGRPPWTLRAMPRPLPPAPRPWFHGGVPARRGSPAAGRTADVDRVPRVQVLMARQGRQVCGSRPGATSESMGGDCRIGCSRTWMRDKRAVARMLCPAHSRRQLAAHVALRQTGAFSAEAYQPAHADGTGIGVVLIYAI